jgi:hypothetical protein
LLGKAGLKVLFDGGIVTLTKHDVFVGKSYEGQGLFVLNVANTINENSSSCAYLVDSINTWHGKLGHVNLGYIKKMKETKIINSLSETNIDKCEVCTEAKPILDMSLFVYMLMTCLFFEPTLMLCMRLKDFFHQILI